MKEKKESEKCVEEEVERGDKESKMKTRKSKLERQNGEEGK